MSFLLDRIQVSFIFVASFPSPSDAYLTKRLGGMVVDNNAYPSTVGGLQQGLTEILVQVS